MSRINNSFRFTGNVGKTPEIRALNNGGKVAEIPLAVDSSYRNKETGERVERVDWFDVVTYSPGLVGIVEQYVEKGREISVRGFCRKQKWESKDRQNQDGTPATDSRYEFVVTDLKFHGKATKPGAPDNGESYTGDDQND